MVCDAICSYLVARAIERLLALPNEEHFYIQWLIRTLASHSLEQRPRIGNQRHATQFPVLCSRFGIAAHHEFASVEVNIAPFNLSCLTNPTAGEGKTRS